MTISLSIKVNGEYEATVKHAVEGVDQPDTVVGPYSEKYISFRHGVPNTLVITEEYVGNRPKAVPAEETPPTAA